MSTWLAWKTDLKYSVCDETFMTIRNDKAKEVEGQAKSLYLINSKTSVVVDGTIHIKLNIL